MQYNINIAFAVTPYMCIKWNFKGSECVNKLKYQEVLNSFFAKAYMTYTYSQT